MPIRSMETQKPPPVPWGTTRRQRFRFGPGVGNEFHYEKLETQLLRMDIGCDLASYSMDTRKGWLALKVRRGTLLGGVGETEEVKVG